MYFKRFVSHAWMQCKQNYKCMTQQYLTWCLESKTNIPAVSQVLLFLATLLVQEDGGLLLKGLFVLQ